MIPRRFFWLFDLLVLCAAFLTAYALLPFQHTWLSLAPATVGWLIPESVKTEAAATLALNVRQPLPPLGEWFWILLSMTPATMLFMEMLGGYAPRVLCQTRARLAATGLFAPFAGLGLVLLILFALQAPSVSRLFVFSFTVLSSLGLAIYRLVLRMYYNRRLAGGHYARNVLLVGSSASIEWMVHYFSTDGIPRTEFRLTGYLCLHPDQACPDLNGAPLERLGGVKELGRLLVNRPITDVIVIHPASGGDWLKQVIEDCDYFRIALRIVPEALLFQDVHDLHVLYRHDLLRLPAVVLEPSHMESDALFVKRLVDLALSAALLVLLSPLFLLTALAIKLTTPRLPVFYPWRVVGRSGVEFTGYKFTSMFPDADERKKDLVDLNEMSGPVFKIRNDPRITPLGRILRKFSINELPQLWSVLKGDMSLVGPRPAFRHELDRYEFWHKRKLSIRPGITCLWQIRGRNKISSFDDWVRLDLEYIDHWSLWLDLRILVRTVWVVIAGTGS